jgi:hypothetical protein
VAGGVPSFVHAGTVQLAILDPDAVLAASGHAERAATEVTTVDGLDGWEFTSIARAPLLVPLNSNNTLRTRLPRRRETALQS